MSKEKIGDKAYSLSEKIVKDINDFNSIHVTEYGKVVPSQDMIRDLGVIIAAALLSYRFVVENKIYEGKPYIAVDLL